MCGIAGLASRHDHRQRADAELRAMCTAIIHRGPDEQGSLVLEHVALGMRRLSVIDVAGGHQPIGNEDGSVQLVFNGEIYNYRQLREQLLRNGHQLATRSDTETIVHLYEEYGDNLVLQLRGMFGFALWDSRRERLLIARDRLGIKPIYYWEHDDGLAFASEARCLTSLARFPAEIDPQSVAEYLALGYVPDPRSIYKDVRKLPPGHILTWDRQAGARISRYWSPAVAENTGIDEQTAIAELRRLFEDAVSCHLESEVPLGAFLSGGIDSSSVVAQMQRLMDRPVKTFSIGFDEPDFDETPYAARVAKALGTEHTELVLRPEAETLVEEVVSAYDEPFADASALPTLLVSRLARQHVTVALSGDGGDELFGGYTRYQYVLDSAEIPKPVRKAFGLVARHLAHSVRGRGRLLNLSRSMRGRYAAQMSAPHGVSDGGVMRPDIASRLGGMDSFLEPLFDDASSRDFLTQMTLADANGYLPGDILTKVDRASMRVSLEARVPLLDHHFAEFAFSLPGSLKLRDGTGKWILRRAVEDLVPAEVLSRSKKGFTLPLRHWFRSSLRGRIEELCARTDARIHEFVDPEAVARLNREHQTGRKDNYLWLWRLLILELWLERSAKRLT